MVKYISDRIAVMHFGKIVELGSADEIYNHPMHPYTKSLLSAVPQPDPESERVRKRTVYTEDSANNVEENFMKSHQNIMCLLLKMKQKISKINLSRQ